MKKGMAVLTVICTLLLTACGQGTAPTRQDKDPAQVSKGETAAAQGPAAPKVDSAPAAPAKSPSFEGKTIKFIVPFSPGAGTDVRARFVAEQLRSYIPGNPLILVENKTGGGGAIGFNHVYQSKPDGLTIAVASTGIPIRWITGAKGHEYDLLKMPLVAAFGTGTVAYGRPDVAKTGKDLTKLGRPVISGHTTPTSSQATMDRVAAEMLGYPVKQVTGYKGYGDIRLSTIKGETEMSWTNATSYLTEIDPHVQRNELVPLFQSGIFKGDKVIRDPRSANVPLLSELYKEVSGRNPEEAEQWPTVKALIGVYSFGVSFWLPPGTPAETYNELVTAFDRMGASADYQKAALKVFAAEDLITVGKEAAAAFAAFAETPPEVRANLSD